MVFALCAMSLAPLCAFAIPAIFCVRPYCLAASVLVAACSKLLLLLLLTVRLPVRSLLLWSLVSVVSAVPVASADFAVSAVFAFTVVSAGRCLCVLCWLGEGCFACVSAIFTILTVSSVLLSLLSRLS